jgi:ligand-binding sensor domain-containing protein/signal transduction histidine kinase
MKLSLYLATYQVRCSVSALRPSLLICLIFASWLNAHSQQSEELQLFTHRSWHIQDGLPDEVIQTLAQTPDHYLWLGTSKGLLRFDGQNFTQFDGRDSALLRAQDILCLLAARDGSLWIGTDGGGLLHYANGRIRAYKASEGLTYPIIRTLYEDVDGTIWVGSDFGIFKLKDNQFVRVDDPVKLVNFGAQSIIGDGHGSVWVGGSRLVRYQGSSYREYTMPKQSGSLRIKSLCETAGGTIWVGTAGGLYRGSQDGEFQKVETVSGGIRTLGKGAKGGLWVGTVGNGLYVQNQNGFLHLSAPSVLPSNTVLGILSDTEENMWVGTQAGLLRLSRTGMRMLPFPNISDSDFGTVFRDADGTIWVCSSHLFRVDHDAMAPYSFPGLSGVTVRTMFRDRSGALWLGTMGSGAYRFGRDGRMTSYHHIGNNYVRGFLQTQDGSVWIFTDGGVSRWKNGHLDLYHLVAGAVRMNVTALAGSPSDSLWIGTPHGLRLFRGSQFADAPPVDQLNDKSVWALHEDPDGALWIGTDAGLYRWKDNLLRHIALDELWNTPAVYSIMEDSSHVMWLSGPTSVLRIKRQDLDNMAGSNAEPIQGMQMFPVSSELQGAELYGGMQPSGALDGDGGVWFPTSQGALHINPRQDRPAPPLPPLVIDRVLLDGRPIDFRNGIDLGPGTGMLEISYAPILLSSQAGLYFRHILKGFDSSWSRATSERTSVYTNLRAGHYTWELQAFYPSNPQQVSSVSLEVKKEAHFYQTIWFVLFCLVTLALIGWLIDRMRSNQLQSRFRVVMQERSRLAREIHDSVIQGCTGVSVLLEAYSAMPSQQTETQEHLIYSARQQIKATIDSARDSVWDLRHFDPNSRGFPQLVQADVEKYLRDSGVELEFSIVGGEKPIGPVVAREALMVVREAVRNALQHGQPSALRLALRYLPGKLSISVLDNGRGFAAADKDKGNEKHFGLIGMRERVARVNGSLTLQSDDGKGTAVNFWVPLDALNLEVGEETSGSGRQI